MNPMLDGRGRFDPAILIPALVAIAVMCGALLDEDSLGDTLLGRRWDLDWPYGYYIFLRFVVCIASVVVAMKGHEWQNDWVPWVFGIQALLYWRPHSVSRRRPRMSLNQAPAVHSSRATSTRDRFPEETGRWGIGCTRRVQAVTFPNAPGARISIDDMRFNYEPNEQQNRAGKLLDGL